MGGGRAHPEIDSVWSELPENKVDQSQSLIDNRGDKSWPFWSNMTDEEQNCYRFSHSDLEVLEQAYMARDKGWMISWKTTNFFVLYVLIEIERWFSPSFLKCFNDLER